MVRRAFAGVVGAVFALLPLVLVNAIVTTTGALNSLTPNADQQSLVVGATALVGGVLLGGGLAGWIAGRASGTAAGGVAGVIAALLYAGSLIGVIMLGGSGREGLPYVQVHPIRASAAILLVAAVLVAVALIAGRIVSPPAQPALAPSAGNATPRYAPGAGPRMDPRYGGQGLQPASHTGWQSGPPRPREPVSAPRPPQSRSGPSGPRYPR